MTERPKTSCAARKASLGAAIAWIGVSVLLPAVAVAGTVVSGPVSGLWDPAGSPYWVEGDLLVGVGDALVIAPGVEVRFRGPYVVRVEGLLTAAGTETDSIRFTWDLPQPAHEWRGVRLIDSDDATLLEYCRIERVRSAATFPEVRGGAIYCETCSPAIRHCLLQHNVSHNSNANGMGGGVACVEASPLIELCVVRHNQADSGGGIATIEYGSAVIRNNLIRDNTAPYSGGGIYAGVRSSPLIENNLILDNRAYGWGGGGVTLWNWYAMNFISKTVKNNVVAGNFSGSDGGGFYIRYDFSFLDNNTVVGNSASRGGGAYVLNQGPGDYPPHLRGFILWENTAGAGPAIHPDPSTGSAVIVTYSDVEGGWTGTGNIDLPPIFEGEAYLLAESSPGVDEGDPDPAYDDVCFPPSRGTERNDMGAYGGPLACQWPLQSSAAEPGRPLEEHDGSLHGAGSIFIRAPRLASGGPVTIAFGLQDAGGAGWERAALRLTLHDVTGRQVRGIFHGPATEAEQRRTLVTASLSPGCYYLCLRAGSRTCVRPILVVR